MDAPARSELLRCLFFDKGANVVGCWLIQMARSSFAEDSAQGVKRAEDYSTRPCLGWKWPVMPSVSIAVSSIGVNVVSWRSNIDADIGSLVVRRIHFQNKISDVEFSV